MTTRDLWDAFTKAGVMIHCIRYGGLDKKYGGEFRKALEGEVVYFPANVPLMDVPEVLRMSPITYGCDPMELAKRNTVVANRVLRKVVRQTGLTFQFSGDPVDRAFEFTGPNPNVLIEWDESVELDGAPITVELSAAI